jgi:hypothetical protein
MALNKTISLPSGISGNYIRLTSYRWDRSTLEASAIFALYLDAAHAQAGSDYLVPVIAKLRLSGEKFSEYLGAAALAEHEISSQLYSAAKTETLLAGGGLSSVSFADAVDV